MHLNKLFLRFSQLKWNSLFPRAEKRLQIESWGIRRSRSLSYENAEVCSLGTAGCSALGRGVVFILAGAEMAPVQGTEIQLGAPWGLWPWPLPCLCPKCLQQGKSEGSREGGREGGREVCALWQSHSQDPGEEQTHPQVINSAHPDPWYHIWYLFITMIWYHVWYVPITLICACHIDMVSLW